MTKKTATTSGAIKSVKKILFIGNSYTSFNNFNDLPETIRQLAESAGVKLDVSAVIGGGRSLEWHYYNPETIEALQREAWDYVVFQEFSTRPLDEPEKMFVSGEALFNRVTSKKVQPVLYLTWSRQFLPETQPRITKAYIELSRRINARIFPAGLAWHKVIAKNADIGLYDPDQSHPTILGTYLNACTFCSAILDINPEKFTNKIRVLNGVTLKIDPEIALILQQSAKQTTQEFKKYLKQTGNNTAAFRVKK